MFPTKPEAYVPVLSYAHVIAITALLDRLRSETHKSVNEVQTSVVENGYATGIVALSAFLVESVVQRAQYLSNTPPAKPIEYLRQHHPSLCDAVEELFVVRDLIAHNHLWDAEVHHDSAGELRFVSCALRSGFGDKKYFRVVDQPTRKTRGLGLNAFPTRVWYNDAVCVLKVLLEFLEAMEARDQRIVNMNGYLVRFEGNVTTFRSVVESLASVEE